MVDSFPSLLFIGKEQKRNDFDSIMKNSFKLPLVLDDLFRAIRARYNYNLIPKENFDKNELKKMIELAKAKKQNIVLYFSDNDKEVSSHALRLVSNIENIDNKLVIYQIKNANSDFLEYLKIKKMPSLLLIVNEYEEKAR